MTGRSYTGLDLAYGLDMSRGGKTDSGDLTAIIVDNKAEKTMMMIRF